MTAAGSEGQVIEVNFRPKAAAQQPPGEFDDLDPVIYESDGTRRKYEEGDPIPDGYYRVEGTGYVNREYPYEETICGRLDMLEADVRTLRRRLAAAERRAGAR
jgi:hypothetical protein